MVLAVLAGCGDGEPPEAVEPASTRAPVALEPAVTSTPEAAATPSTAARRRVRKRSESRGAGRWLYAMVHDRRVARLNPVSLEREETVHLRSWPEVSALSPDGSAAAFAYPKAGVETFDLRAMRPVARPLVRNRLAYNYALTWPREDRLLLATVAAGSTTLHVLDPRRRGRMSRRDVAGEPVSWAPTPDGMAILVAPFGKIGALRLGVASADGSWRELAVPVVKGGFQQLDASSGGEPVAVNHRPGLAIGDGAAYVVDTTQPRVVRIDLASGEAQLHTLRVVARAAKMADRSYRQAAWLGDGRLAYWGGRDRPNGRIDSVGLNLVDTSEWTSRVLVRRIDSVWALPGGRLVASGVPDDGLAVFDRYGRLVRRTHKGVLVGNVSVAGDHIYVGLFDARGRPGASAVLSHEGELLATPARQPPHPIGAPPR